jgi:adiponectin receptor
MPVITRSHKTQNHDFSPKKSTTNKLNPAFNDNGKCINCWGIWGHRSSVDKVYWRDGILYGYRKESNWKQTFFTLFSMHNETMNIWTHLIGFSFTFCAIIYYFIDKDILFSFAYPFILNVSNDFQFNNDVFITHSPYGPVYFFAFIISASICLLFSTIYHWFSCMSPKHHDDLLYLDVTGVALLVGSSYFPAIYIGFYCFESLQTFYLYLSLFVLVVGVASTWTEVKIFNQSLRTIVFAGKASHRYDCE